jgi:hypothetical protein
MQLKKQKKYLSEEILKAEPKILWLLDGWDKVVPARALKRIQEDNDEPDVKWLLAGSADPNTFKNDWVYLEPMLIEILSYDSKSLIVYLGMFLWILN